MQKSCQKTILFIFLIMANEIFPIAIHYLKRHEYMIINNKCLRISPHADGTMQSPPEKIMFMGGMAIE